MNEIELFAANRPAMPEYSSAAKTTARARLTAAPAVSRRRRRWLVVLAPLGAAAALAAPVVVVVTTGTSAPARAEVAAAARRTFGQSYTMTGIIQGSGGAPVRSTGAFDPPRGLGHIATQEPIGPTEILFVGGFAYVKVPHPNYMNLPGFKPNRGKPWIRYPRGSVPEDESAVITRAEQDPQRALAYLNNAKRVYQAGGASGPGWTGHRYSFTVRVDTIMLTGTVAIDEQGRVRRLDLLKPETGGSWLRGTVTYGDYGTPVSVTAPPADQIGDRRDRQQSPLGDPKATKLPG